MQSFTTQQARERFTKEIENITKAKKLVNDITLAVNNNRTVQPYGLIHTSINRPNNSYNPNNPNNPNEKLISIVMCACNRSTQTFYTLQTIKSCIDSINNKSDMNVNVQIIIVEDSTNDKLDIDRLKAFGLYIDHITILQSNKFWINPCVNYNIGFAFIKGDYVVIQNPEVCYIGNILDYTLKHLQPNIYLVFDVINMGSINDNHTLYRATPQKFKHYLSNTRYGWYQHHTHKNRCFHFLSAITTSDLKKIGGFDLDYCMGVCYDDDAFVDQIRYAGISIISVPNNDMSLYGIHQWHPPTYLGMNRSDLHNKNLLLSKRLHHQNTKSYFTLDDKSNVDLIR